MFHGTSHITYRTTIDSEVSNTLLTHQYFNTKLPEHQGSLIVDGVASNEHDEAILQFVTNQQLPYENIEYWFQSKTTEDSFLSPHCDYNVLTRINQDFNPHEWIKAGKKDEFISPLTIAAYLEISDDLIGGELCISSATWEEFPWPYEPTREELIDFKPYEINLPVNSEVLYFQGSMNYHWVEKVIRGSRKSLLINFWPSRVKKVNIY